MEKMNKRISKLLLIMIMLFSTFACNKNENVINENDDGENQTVVEARTAIVFDLKENNKAFVIRDNETNDAYVGMRLLAGDSVVTDTNSSIYLRIDDDKNILLNEDSRLDITEISKGKLALSVVQGSLFFDVENKLTASESMTFEAGGTTMSIRGTSGIINLTKKDFVIFEGKGEVNVSGLKVEIKPGNRLSLADDDIIVYPVTVNDLTEGFNEYLNNNEDYKEKLLDNGWIISEDGQVDDIKVDETAPNEYGFKQDKNGAWSLKNEKLENNEESEPYKEETEVKVVIKIEEKKTEVVEEEKPSTPSTPSSPVSDPEICTHCQNEIVEGDTDHIALNSSDALAALKAKFTDVADYLDGKMSSDVYLCELGGINDITLDTLYDYSYLDSQLICHKLNESTKTQRFITFSDNTYSTDLPTDVLFKDLKAGFDTDALANKLYGYYPLNSLVICSKLAESTKTQELVIIDQTGLFVTNLPQDVLFKDLKADFDTDELVNKLLGYYALNSETVKKVLALKNGIITNQTNTNVISGNHLYNEIKASVEDAADATTFNKIIIKYLIFNSAEFKNNYKTCLDETVANIIDGYSHGLCDQHCLKDLASFDASVFDKHKVYFCYGIHCDKPNRLATFCKHGYNEIELLSFKYPLCDDCEKEFESLVEKIIYNKGN